METLGLLPMMNTSIHKVSLHSAELIDYFNVSYLMKGRKLESPQLKAVFRFEDEPVIAIMMCNRLDLI